MSSQTLMDIEKFPNPGFPEAPQPDPDIINEVNNALACLEPPLKEIILKHYWEKLTLKEIARYYKINTAEARSRLRCAQKRLRPLLADFVASRWHFKPQGACRICSHSRRDIIDKMLSQKDPDETWGLFGKRLESEIGEKIHPPRILIAHLSHISKKGAIHA